MATSRVCSVDGCVRPVNARGWCSMHLSRWQRHGEVGGPESTYRPDAACSIEGCGRLSQARGLCGMHYARLRKNGSTADPRPGLLDRVMSKVEKRPDGCWIWVGAVSHGYGRVRVGQRVQQAHRVLYELLRGAVPGGCELDHLCVTPACVNPDHLDPVTHRENMLRGPTNRAGRNAVKTHCPSGHPYDQANTSLRPDGSRRCRECNRLRCAARDAARRLSR